MLQRLLDILQGGGSHTVDDLARRLDATPSLVDMMIDELVRMGYLSAAPAACTKQCTGCSLGGCVVAKRSGRIWSSTGKK